MNIIWLSGEGIYPHDSGGKVVNYNRIKGLVQHSHKIHLISVIDNDSVIEPQIIGLKDIVSSECFYNRKKHMAGNLLGYVIYPYTVASRTSRTIENAVLDICEKENIDLIMLDTPALLNNVKRVCTKNNLKCILYLHNIEYLSMRSLAKGCNNKLKKLLYIIDAKRYECFEKRFYHNDFISAYVLLSEADFEFFKANMNYKNRPLFFSPIGADVHDDFEPEKHDDVNVVIIGKMSYEPNAEGVLWLYEKVWPIVHGQMPRAKLYIVGKDPVKEITKINDRNVIVTGTVESVEDYYKLADVAVVPIFSGGGVKTKLIEASSYRVPIVCTSAGAVGTKFKNEQHILISDDANEFADNILVLLNDRKRSSELSENCYALFKKEYTWESICEDLSDFVSTL